MEFIFIKFEEFLLFKFLIFTTIKLLNSLFFNWCSFYRAIFRLSLGFFFHLLSFSLFFFSFLLWEDKFCFSTNTDLIIYIGSLKIRFHLNRTDWALVSSFSVGLLPLFIDKTEDLLVSFRREFSFQLSEFWLRKFVKSKILRGTFYSRRLHRFNKKISANFKSKNKDIQCFFKWKCVELNF